MEFVYSLSLSKFVLIPPISLLVYSHTDKRRKKIVPMF